MWPALRSGKWGWEFRAKFSQRSSALNSTNSKLGLFCCRAYFSWPAEPRGREQPASRSSLCFSCIRFLRGSDGLNLLVFGLVEHYFGKWRRRDCSQEKWRMLLSIRFSGRLQQQLTFLGGEPVWIKPNISQRAAVGLWVGTLHSTHTLTTSCWTISAPMTRIRGLLHGGRALVVMKYLLLFFFKASPHWSFVKSKPKS